MASEVIWGRLSKTLIVIFKHHENILTLGLNSFSDDGGLKMKNCSASVSSSSVLEGCCILNSTIFYALSSVLKAALLCLLIPHKLNSLSFALAEKLRRNTEDPTASYATHSVWKWIKMSRLTFWHFSPIFDLSGNTVWPQASGFQIFGIFNQVLSTFIM